MIKVCLVCLLGGDKHRYVTTTRRNCKNF